LMQREVKNGVRTLDFLKAVSWCQAPAVEEALADVARRTDDPQIKAVLDRRPRKSPWDTASAEWCPPRGARAAPISRRARRCSAHGLDPEPGVRDDIGARG
jgi:hypothetical protein